MKSKKNVKKIEEKDELVRSLKATKGSLIGFATLIILFSVFFLGHLIISGTGTILSLKTKGIETTLLNESSVKFISLIKGYSTSEVFNIFSKEWTTVSGAILDIILPLIVALIAIIALIYSSYKLLFFAKKIANDKTLFTIENLKIIKKIRKSAVCSCFLLFIVFDLGFINWLMAEISFEVIIYLFKYCIEMNQTKNE